MSPAVRNIRGIGRKKPIPIYIPIPPISGAVYKIEVTRSDGTLDDITNVTLEGELNDGATSTIGNFEFKLDNSGEDYTNVWAGNEIVSVYIDYDTTATTKRFRGRIEKVSYRNNQVKIIGRSESLVLLNRYAFGTSNNYEASLLIEDVLEAFYPGKFTYNNINVSTTNITSSWEQVSPFEIIQEVCTASGFDFYIDSDLDAHFFESGSVKNTTEAVSHEMNIINIDDFGQDYSLIRNAVIVEGKHTSVDSVTGNTFETPIVYATKSEDATYGVNSTYGYRELVIKDDNITSRASAINRADYELSNALNPSVEGECECPGLATIQPGEQVYVSAPSSNLPPSYRTIISYRHKFGGMMTTTLIINKSSEKLSKVIKKMISTEGTLKLVSNPDAMAYTWNIDLTSDSGTHTNTLITNGFLQTDGSASGTWVSDTLSLDEDISQGEVRINGTALTGTKVQVSTNNGTTYTTVWGTGGVSSFSSGKQIKLKVILSSASTQIGSLVLLYK